MLSKVAIGQDSHRFDKASSVESIILGGVPIPHPHPLSGNSDADVILHALTNAVSGITGKNVLGFKADELAKQGLKDSKLYLKKALNDLLPNHQIEHISISVECKLPLLKPYIFQIRSTLANLCNIKPEQVGLTATSGEGLTDFGKGLGIQCFCVITVSYNKD